MVFASYNHDDCWRELHSLAASAGVSVEHLCTTVEAATQFARASVSAHKGISPYSVYDDDLEQVVRGLWDDDFELAIKDLSWDGSKHPRDKDGRFTNSGASGAQANASIPYGVVVQPTPYFPPKQHYSASQARDELIRQGKRLEAARKPLEGKLRRAKELLKQLNAQHPSDDAERDALNHKRKEVAKQVEAHQRALESAERRHLTQLRQLLYVPDPTPVNVRFDIRPAYVTISPPLVSRQQKDAALTGAEEMRRMVSAKIAIGDMFFEHESDKTKRSRYWAYRRVRLTADAGTRVVVHEFGHGIERLNPTIKQKAIAFRNSRTQGEPKLPLNQFDPEYGANEYTRKDRFINPYMGKIYTGDSDTEIITMGMEYFYSDPVKLATEDREYFDFIYDTLRGN